MHQMYLKFNILLGNFLTYEILWSSPNSLITWFWVLPHLLWTVSIAIVGWKIKEYLDYQRTGNLRSKQFTKRVMANQVSEWKGKGVSITTKHSMANQVSEWKENRARLFVKQAISEVKAKLLWEKFIYCEKKLLRFLSITQKNQFVYLWL